MMRTAWPPASDLDTTEPEWVPAGQALQDVLVQLRLMLAAGTSFAIATVVGAHGTVLRQPGTVLVISESGETIGFNPLARSTAPSGMWPPQRWQPGRTSSATWKSTGTLPATSGYPAGSAWTSTPRGCGQATQRPATCCVT